MNKPLKYALLPSFIALVLLAPLGRFISYELISVITCVLCLFISLFLVFTYKDFKEAITELHSDDEDDTEH